MLGLRVAELLLDGGRDPVDVVEGRDVLRRGDAGLRQLPSEQTDVAVDHLVDEHLEALELELAASLRVHRLDLRIPQRLVGIAGRWSQQVRSVVGHGGTIPNN